MRRPAECPWSVWHRLRKYLRKKRGHGRRDDYTMLYWRYHARAYGRPLILWAPDPRKRPKGA